MKWRKLTSEELNIKKEIYNECREINLKLYYLLNKGLESIQYEGRYCLEKLKNEIFKLGRKKEGKEIFLFHYILKSLYLIKEKISKDEKNLDFFIFLLNIQKVSENKENFKNKILNYFKYETELEEKDIVEFLIRELECYDLIKRQEKCSSGNLNNLEKTYILLDRHEKLKEVKIEKNEIVKKLVSELEENRINYIIKNILSKLQISKLVVDLNEKIENEKLDTELYGVYKKHYEECTKDVEFNKLSLEEKELYKIIYRYLKGRIEKILQNRDKIKNKELMVEEIFNKEILLKKIEIRVKQYLLEHILYLGKLKHHNIDEVNTIRFVEEHANEELSLELITLFSATNVELNRLLKVKGENESYEKDYDFFSAKPDKGKIKIKDTNSVMKFELLKKLKFINSEATETNQEAIDFLKEAYNLRNNILHGKNEEIIEDNKKNLSKSYKNINELIEELRPSDNEICKSLNLDIIFKGNMKINDINAKLFGNNREKIYLPSFSKLVPEIKNIIESYDKNGTFNDERIKKIVLNGAIYVNKILYLKECSNKDGEFIKNLKEELNKDSKEKSKYVSIEELYKKSQISASKGNKKAIYKYQRKIIEIYLKYLKENYVEILDFSKLNLNIEQIENDIKNRKNSENKVLIESIKQKVFPENDFEYIISIFALLNDNIFINKIRNRFFSTDTWLKNNRYSNIIKILDEVISVNLLRTELLNISIDIEEIKDDVLIEDIENIIPEIREEILQRTKKDFKTLLGNNVISKEGLSNEDIDKIRNMEDAKINLDFVNNEIKVSLKEYGSLPPNGVLSRNASKYYNNEIAKKIDQISILTFTKKSIGTISDEKFRNIYWQERKESDESKKIFVYNKNILYLVTKHNFEKLYKNFLEEELNNLKLEDTKYLRDLDLRREKNLKVDNTLKEINEKVRVYSKEYKKKFIENLKNNDEYFGKVVSGRFKNYQEFKEIYDEVSEYKKIRDVVNFNPLNKVYNYLIEINWKLAIQMARVERDLHYIVNGLNELELIELGQKPRDGISRAYPKYKFNKETNKDELRLEECHYNFDIDNYNKFEKICGKFGIDLSKEGELQQEGKGNIRNYISHFYILRKPFVDISISEAIKKVSELLSYRTRYNNSTYSSVFEVFKKDVELNYDFLKKKIELNGKTYDEVVQRKKISCLELESYLDYKPMIKKVLF
ncbi:hypothetical protein [Sebaldella sp. S0638]|uniref:hypothetical protein n=1 Tax=Sebaldella sp. S0638 TaxID=2957809 RepID=UPI0020A1CC77|nr:hypothetical protein [Sebaldella sp. S0638]MCP1226490.1 hypothetical protein [Sebaldella sp. S0638]